MIDAFVQGLMQLFQPEVFLFLMLGVVFAVIIGVVPIISGFEGVVLALPFIFGLNPVVILPFLLAIIGVNFTGGAVTSILAGTPGGGPETVAIFDGYPMTRKGEGGRAVGAAVTASVLGGVLTVVIALLMMPLVVPVALSFRAPEMVLVIMLGLCFLAILTRGSRIKGLTAAGLGILLSLVGFSSITAIPRFSFGITYLYDGINLIVLALALFAVPEIIALVSAGKAIAPVDIRKTGILRRQLQGVQDVFHHWRLLLLSSAIGYIIGIIPGIGTMTSVFVSYGQAKQTSKNRDKFGRGIVEGVIAPMGACNSAVAGELLTTLALGIPGSGVMVLMLGAFLLLGIQPGPKLLTDNTALCFTMLLSIIVANLGAGIICYFGNVYLIKITRISPLYLFSLVLPIVFIGSYVIRGNVWDIAVVIIFSILGICAKLFGYSRPALLLGFIMGDLFEYYFVHAYETFGSLFFLSSPICIGLILIIFAILGQDALKPGFLRWFKSKK